MLLDPDLQVNHSLYYQLRFCFKFQDETYECFATAPKCVLVPSASLIAIQSLGVQGDVMISPSDVDEKILAPFIEKAVECWILEISCIGHDVS